MTEVKNRGMGSLVREYRIKAYMSQEDLSKASGVSRVAIANIERGAAKPKVSTLKVLAEAMNVKLNDLIFE